MKLMYDKVMGKGKPSGSVRNQISDIEGIENIEGEMKEENKMKYTTRNRLGQWSPQEHLLSFWTY